MGAISFKIHCIDEKLIAELQGNEFIINDVQDALDLLAEAGMNQAGSLIIAAENLSPDFFDLKTKLAGEILQKFSNYRAKLAITGDFSAYKSKSLRDFIRECNRGRQIFFCDDVESALKRLE